MRGINAGGFSYIARGVLACLFMLCVLPSCEKPPVESIIRAEKTLQEARDVKADRYVPIPFEKADRALNQAKYFVKAKKYKEAAGSADLAERYARQSIDLVPAVKEEYASKSAATLAEIKGSLAGLEKLTEKVSNKRTKKRMEDLLGPFIEKWGVQVESLQTKLGREEPFEIYNAVEAGKKDFDKALEKLEALLRNKKTRPR